MSSALHVCFSACVVNHRGPSCVDANAPETHAYVSWQDEGNDGGLGAGQTCGEKSVSWECAP